MFPGRFGTTGTAFLIFVYLSPALPRMGRAADHQIRIKTEKAGSPAD